MGLIVTPAQKATEIIEGQLALHGDRRMGLRCQPLSGFMLYALSTVELKVIPGFKSHFFEVTEQARNKARFETCTESQVQASRCSSLYIPFPPPEEWWEIKVRNLSWWPSCSPASRAGAVYK